MTKALIPAAALALMLLTACDSGGPAAKPVTTTMDAVEVEPGTISDAMIMLDDSGLDGTAIDTSVPEGPAAPKAAPGAVDPEAAPTEAAPDPAPEAE